MGFTSKYLMPKRPAFTTYGSGYDVIRIFIAFQFWFTIIYLQDVFEENIILSGSSRLAT